MGHSPLSLRTVLVTTALHHACPVCNNKQGVAVHSAARARQLLLPALQTLPEISRDRTPSRWCIRVKPRVGRILVGLWHRLPNILRRVLPTLVRQAHSMRQPHRMAIFHPLRCNACLQSDKACLPSYSLALFACRSQRMACTHGAKHATARGIEAKRRHFTNNVPLKSPKGYLPQ